VFPLGHHLCAYLSCRDIHTYIHAIGGVHGLPGFGFLESLDVEFEVPGKQEEVGFSED